MKKKLIAAVIILVIAAAAYICINLFQRKPEEKIPEEQFETLEAETYDDAEIVFSERPSESILSVDLTNYDNNYVLHFERNNENIYINGYENILYNTQIINTFMSTCSMLTYTYKIENPENIDEYGFSQPFLKAVISYDDGAESTVTIGNKTEDDKYYYVMFDNDKDIYISPVINYDFLTFELSDFIYKYIPAVSAEKILYLDIVQKDRDEIEIIYNEQGNTGEAASYGLVTLTMLKPASNTAVYPPNLQDTVLSSLTYLRLDKAYKLNPDENDLAQCGLNDPFLKIYMYDMDKNSLELNIGNEASESSYYCTTPLYPHIFTIQKSAIQPFIDVDILKFTERFIQLINRRLVSSIDFMENNEKKYEVKLEGEIETDSKRDTRKTYINGKEIGSEEFGLFYQVFAGITFDSYTQPLKPSGAPEYEFKVHFTDGSEKSIKYFNYSEDLNFCVAQEDDLDAVKLVSRRSITEIFTAAESYSK